MDISNRLTDLKVRGLIDDNTVTIVLQIKQRLANYWQADATTPQVTMMLFHFACALGRVQRDCTVAPLYQEFLDEIKSSDNFHCISMINSDLMKLIPFVIPQDEQTYFLADIFSLLAEQPWISANIRHSFRLIA